VAWFALISGASDLAVDVYPSREQAEKELREAVEDEPEWVSLLAVVPVDLPEPDPN
jgi:hypothetical protein